MFIDIRVYSVREWRELRLGQIVYVQGLNDGEMHGPIEITKVSISRAQGQFVQAWMRGSLLIYTREDLPRIFICV